MIFLFGVLQLATALTPLASDNAKTWLSHFTSNRFAGIATVVLQSSSAMLGIVFVDQLALIARALPDGGAVARQIANAHVTFNVIGVALFVGFLTPIAHLLERAIPSRAAGHVPPDAARVSAQ